jgi:putative membrane protein
MNTSATSGGKQTRDLNSIMSRLASKVEALFTGGTSSENAAGARLDTNTQLSVERTMLAHERTLMAWVRTATSLISFGFTIYKFFQLEVKGSVPVSQVIGPRTFALLMIAMGLFALVVATLQHLVNMRRQREDYGVTRRSLAGLVAGLISLLGIVAMVAVIFQL